MPPKVAKKLQKIDNDLTLLLEVLKDYSDKTLNKKPGDDKWSVMQVIHHLILVEGYGQSYVEKKLSFNPALKKAGFPAAWRTFLMKTYLKFPFKIKAPDGVSGEQLPENSSFWETAKQWKVQREGLRKMLENMPLEHYDKEIYKHPFAGRLTLAGLLDFHEGHFARHRKQINKILKKSFKIKD